MQSDEQNPDVIAAAVVASLWAIKSAKKGRVEWVTRPTPKHDPGLINPDEPVLRWFFGTFDPDPEWTFAAPDSKWSVTLLQVEDRVEGFVMPEWMEPLPLPHLVRLTPEQAKKLVTLAMEAKPRMIGSEINN